MNGSLVPENFAKACSLQSGVSAFTDEIRVMIQMDGALYLGGLSNTGIILESKPILPPDTRMPPPHLTTEGRPVLTAAVADLGQSVQFLNFHNVISANACTGCVAWGPFLASIMSHYTAADMMLMYKAMGKLPNTFGSKAAKKELYNVAYATYYRATGLDFETKRPPTDTNAEWAAKYEFK